jgi:predicted transcriptional regulator
MVTPIWKSILKSLSKGERTTKQLAKNLRVSRASIGARITELKRDKLIRKCKSIGRENVYAITQKGRKILERK